MDVHNRQTFGVSVHSVVLFSFMKTSCCTLNDHLLNEKSCYPCRSVSGMRSVVSLFPIVYSFDLDDLPFGFDGDPDNAVQESVLARSVGHRIDAKNRDLIGRQAARRLVRDFTQILPKSRECETPDSGRSPPRIRVTGSTGSSPVPG
jgi:hypothetical protein